MWSQDTNETIMPVQLSGEKEPYGVFRRSALNPLYHPFFLDYGRDKVELYWRLRMDDSMDVSLLLS